MKTSFHYNGHALAGPSMSEATEEMPAPRTAADQREHGGST